MNRAEMTEIFAVMMLAWPNAEIFRAPSQRELEEKLAPAITLWATCLEDIDAWTAQKAILRLCRTSKFPPSIAELREAAEGVSTEVRAEIRQCWEMYCQCRMLYGDDPGKLERLMGRRGVKTVQAMGGWEALKRQGYKGFRATYEMLLRSNPVGLPSDAGYRQLKTAK